MDVDAVEKRSADLLAVVLDLPDGAAALAFRIAVEPARARIRSQEILRLDRLHRVLDVAAALGIEQIIASLSKARLDLPLWKTNDYQEDDK